MRDHRHWEKYLLECGYSLVFRNFGHFDIFLGAILEKETTGEEYIQKSSGIDAEWKCWLNKLEYLYIEYHHNRNWKSTQKEAEGVDSTAIRFVGGIWVSLNDF